MIRLTRLNGSEMYLNADLIATVESHHDTVITLVDGKTYVVAETASEVVTAITTYRASILALAESVGIPVPAAGDDAEPELAPLLVLRPHRRTGE